MGRINLLDVEISNKIAAGEVVERPASVVKELVENSIDAGAKKIVVEIKNGGNTYIRVTDDGCGMEKEDAVVAFLRHATSKISTAEDLNAIYTLGFRGEALSSIGAVSMVDLFTKRREDDFGTHTVCEGGEIVSDDNAGIPDGTSFVVKKLFYNVPARMKFLKKDATEAGYISDIMTRFILAHPEISFKLISNNKEVLFSSGDGSLKNCIYSVYGRDYATSMIEVDYNTEYVTVKGLTGKGSTARANRNYQSFFVNGRYIKSPLIMRAVEEAYKNQVMIGKFPTSVLNVEINPSLIDINVHPTKLEVKFSNENEVYAAVYHAVHEALYRIMDIPEIKKETKESEPVKPQFVKDTVIPNGQLDITEALKHHKQKEETVVTEKKEPVKSIFDTVKTTAASPEIFDSKLPEIKQEATKKEEVIRPESKETQQQVIEKTEKPVEKTLVPEIKEEFKTVVEEKTAKKTEAVSEIKEEIQEKAVIKAPDFKLVGQVFDTYIIIEIENEMLMIDQHAAHERLNFEKLKKELENKKVYSQSLLIPVVVDLSANEMAVFNENIDFITSLGFDVEEFGNNSVIIRSVPIDSISEEVSDLFIEMISQLADNKREIITQKRERLLYTIACKAAVKANCRLDEKEQRELVKKVFELENINTCPHGRPIMIAMTKYEIEKQFKRIT